MSRRSNFDMGRLLGGRSRRQDPPHQAMVVPPPPVAANDRALRRSPRATAADGIVGRAHRGLGSIAAAARRSGVTVTRSKPRTDRTGKPAPRAPGRPAVL